MPPKEADFRRKPLRYADESRGPLRGPTFVGITEKEGFEPSKEVKTPLTP
jgi:hypothetical protein